MPNIKDYEGSVPVDGNVTPTTREKIEQIDANNWPSMSVSELYDQRILLSNRIAKAAAAGNISVVQQLERGLQTIDALLNERGLSGEINLL